MKNTIYLRRNNKVIVNKGQDQLPDVYLATALKNIESLGYTFTENLMETIRTFSADDFMFFYKELVKDLKKNLGAHVRFSPMYPNFPSQVMEASEVELFLNAIIHYVTGLLPAYEVKERFPLLDRIDLKLIDLGNEADFDGLIKNLISANTSISETDKTDIEWAIANYKDVSKILPSEIPLKENVGFVVSTLLKYEKASINDISAYFKTATDVLRLATALSDGDVSLATNTKFRKFKRPERRLLLGLLDQCPAVTEDMIRYKKRWIRLGEILHPTEYKGKYSKVKEAFDILRNDKPFATFGGKVEAALAVSDMTTAVKLLKTRPGQFARKLDHLLRLTNDYPFVVKAFNEVAGEVATPVLLQVLAHFKNKHVRNELRTFFPKGNIAKLVAIPNVIRPIHEEAAVSIVKSCEVALANRFSELPSLGNVFVDNQLSDFLVPFSQRSASKSLRTIVRGSKMDMPEGDTIRFFLWWKEGMLNGQHTGRVDIDLSAIMYDEDFNYKEHVSYTNRRSTSYNTYFSGDITSAPNGASEFIDLDIPSVLNHGGRYVVVSLNSFTSQPFSTLPECFAGWMIRQHPNSGEIYEPSTVQDKVDLTSDTQICVPVILDLKERKVIWADLALTRNPDYSNNIEGNQRGLIAMSKAISTLVKPNLHDLFYLHAAARGIIVHDPAEADTVFSVHEGITPFDIETIMAEYLA